MNEARSAVPFDPCSASGQFTPWSPGRSIRLALRTLASVLCLSAAPVLAQGHDGAPESGFSAEQAALGAIRELADQGNSSAQFELGVIYEYGRGVRQDDAEAVRWYRRASEQGLARAQYKLGAMYDNGWGVVANDTEAVRWYRNAAEQGHPFAQHDLAFMYVAGTGVEQDYVQAYRWLSVAIANGFTMMDTHLQHVSKEMTMVEILEAEILAREWMEKYQ